MYDRPIPDFEQHALKTKQKSKRIKSKENTIFKKNRKKSRNLKKAQHNWR